MVAQNTNLTTHKQDKVKLRSLTWKYFLGQKAMEIGKVLLILAVIVFIPYLLGHHIGDGYDVMCSGEIGEYDREVGSWVYECPSWAEWFEGVVYILFTAMAILLILIIGYAILAGIYDWLKSNWKLADKKAKTELNRHKR